MQLGKKTIVIIYVLFMLGMISTVQAARKSVYAVTNHSYSTIAAFKIVNNELEYQTETNLHFGSGAVGLAIDPDSATMFVTYEGSNIIEMVNAKTMVSEENPVTVPGVGTSGLSGITFDQTKQKLCKISDIFV